jgi:putative oxidoreductase
MVVIAGLSNLTAASATVLLCAPMAAGQIDIGLLVVRVAVGATMIAHGYNHIYRGGKIKGTAGWFASLGMKPGILHAWLASLTELAAGAGLVVGLLTPLAAGAIFGTLAVAFVTNHRKAGFFVFRRPTEGWEYLMNLLAACIAIGSLGAGRWSLDNALDIHFHGWIGLIVTLVIGLGGALSLLVVFWRPPAPAPPA